MTTDEVLMPTAATKIHRSAESPYKVFVQVGRGHWIQSHISIISTTCPWCGAAPGALCVFGERVRGGTHAVRRIAYQKQGICRDCGAKSHRRNCRCRECQAKINRARTGEYARRAAARHPERTIAYRLFKAAVASGKLVRPNRCSECNELHQRMNPIVGHHPDYSKPLEVVWLCRDCHVAEHRRLRKEAA